MKRGVIIWLGIIVICLGLAVRQRENLNIVWREYSSLYRHVKYEDYSMKLHGPFIQTKVAKKDPEAAAVVETQLAVWFNESRERIDMAAEKLLEQSDNEFILFELIKSFWYLRENVIDPQIVLRLTEKLIALEPNNANYHYIKSYLLLEDRKGGDIDAALEQMEYANNCSRYDFPYENYRHRAIDIANKAKLGRFLTTRLCRPDDRNPFIHDIRGKLITHANAAFTEGDVTKGMRITNALARMQARQFRIKGSTERAILFLGFHSGAYNFGHWNEPYGLELQRVNLIKEHARKNRLDLCALMILPKKPQERTSEQGQRRKQGQFQSFAPYPAVHTGRMFVAFLSVCAILLLISAACGSGEKAKIEPVAVISFTLGCVYYFCIAQGPFLLSLLDSLNSICGGCHSYYVDAFRPNVPPLGYIIDEEPLLAALFLAGPIVVALALWGLGFLRPKKGAFWKLWYIRVFAALVIGGVAAYIVMCGQNPEHPDWWKSCALAGGFFAILAWVIITFAWWLFRCRIIRLFLVTTFLGVVTLLFGGYRYIHYLPMIVFILIAAIIAVVKPNEGSALKTLVRLLSRKPDVATVRNKCLRLAAPFIAVYWVLFILLTPIVAKCINLELKEYEPTDRRLILAEPNEAYQEVISKLESQDVTKNNIQRLLGMVIPEDLPGLLQNLQQKEFKNDYYGLLSPWPKKEVSKKEEAKREQMRQRALRLNDDDLVTAMRGCGRDVVKIITDFLDEPDAEQALAARARLGDASVKEKLKTLLQTRILQDPDDSADNQTRQWKWYVNKPLKASEIIGALACVSEPNEATENFLHFVENRKVRDLIEDNEFFENLIFLPVSYTQKVIKTYLAKARDWQPQIHEPPFLQSSYRTARPLRRLVGYYGDRQIAEDVFKTMLSATVQEEEFKAFDISPYFRPQSAELLKEGLASSNHDMRAWCVWQLRKIGYRFQPEELNRLLNDESWKVRANALFAGGKDAARIAEKDENAFVRLVATLVE